MEIVTNHFRERLLKNIIVSRLGVRSSFRAAVAFFTSPDLIDEIASSPQNKVHLVVSLNPPTNYYALKRILRHSNVRVDFVSSGLHSKIYILDASDGSSVAVMGSSNLTAGGLHRNIETNVVLRGDEVRQYDVESHFNYVCSLSEILTPEILDKYKQEFDDFSNTNPLQDFTKRTPKIPKPLKSQAAAGFIRFWNAAYSVGELVLKQATSSRLFAVKNRAAANGNEWVAGVTLELGAA